MGKKNPIIDRAKEMPRTSTSRGSWFDNLPEDLKQEVQEVGDAYKSGSLPDYRSMTDLWKLCRERAAELHPDLVFCKLSSFRVWLRQHE